MFISVKPVVKKIDSIRDVFVIDKKRLRQLKIINASKKSIKFSMNKE